MRCVFNEGNDCNANRVRSLSMSANFTQEIAECPQMYPIWWSATGLTASVLLIELDRFLAIRFPLKVFFPRLKVFSVKAIGQMWPETPSKCVHLSIILIIFWYRYLSKKHALMSKFLEKLLEEKDSTKVWMGDVD